MPRPRGGVGRAALGAVMALQFNVAFIAAPFLAAELWRKVANGLAYGYPHTQTALWATREQVLHRARLIVVEPKDRTPAWNALIFREITRGEASVARGLALSAPVLVSPRDRARMLRQLPTHADDAKTLAAAMTIMDPGVAERFARETGAGRDGAGADVGLFMLGGMDDLVRSARDFASGRPVDAFDLSLSGVGLILAPARPATGGGEKAVRSGASVVTAAARAGRLHPDYAARLRALTLAALPPERLRQELSVALAQPAFAETPEQALVVAFERAVSPQALTPLAEELSGIANLARATSPDGAAWLLQEAVAPGDLAKLELIAAAAGERAVALAKHLPDDSLASTARGSILFTPTLWAQLVAAGLIALSLLATPIGFVVATIEDGRRRAREARRAMLRSWRPLD